MDIRVIALALLLITGGSMLGAYAILVDDDSSDMGEFSDYFAVDPLIQSADHDHRNSSSHNLSTDNIEFASYNKLSNPGNAEVQVMEAPDGRTYAYQAGWSEVHTTDVTD
ncbi:MAG: hypothetical protein QF817_05695, partial [Candidatus Poseidoniaceae archaeon]|nr:hypothetical protein [Candidatus Poseidoniaceae archaeon]